MIRVVEGIAGRPRLGELIATLAAAAPEARIARPRPFLTTEGEHGVVIDRVAGDTLRVTAYVFGDASYTRLDGETSGEETFDELRRRVAAAAYAHKLRLGDRRRRVFYAPPAGWAGVARAGETMWISPACPRRHQLIRAMDSRRAATLPKVKNSRRLDTQAGLTAQVATHVVETPAGKRVVSDFTATDGQHLYAFRLESDEESFAEASKVFAQVVASVRPLARRTVDADVFAGWAD